MHNGHKKTISPHQSHRNRVTNKTLEGDIAQEIHIVSLDGLIAKAQGVIGQAEKAIQGLAEVMLDETVQTLFKILYPRKPAPKFVAGVIAKVEDHVWCFHRPCNDWHGLGNHKSLMGEFDLSSPCSYLDVAQVLARIPEVDAVLSFTHEPKEKILAVIAENQRREMIALHTNYELNPVHFGDRELLRSDNPEHISRLSGLRMYPPVGN